MMSKVFSKTVKKTTLWATIIAVILAAAVVICALFGFNKDIALNDKKTLTVSVNRLAYNEKRDEIIDVCDAWFDKYEQSYLHVIDGEMSGDECEIIFVFDKDAKLEEARDGIKAFYVDEMTWNPQWKGVFVDVSTSTEVAEAVLARGFILRAAIAGAVFTVLAFAYVAIRYRKLAEGLVAGVSVLLGMLLTAGVIILTRAFVTTNVAAAIAVAGMVTAVMVLFTFAKLRAMEKEGGEGSTEEKLVSAIAWKESAYLAGGIAVGMLFVGITGRTTAAWFAVAALIGLVAALFVALIFAPAAYLSIKTSAEKRPSKKGYVGAKKTSKKEKKNYAKTAESVEETAEAPVEEAPAEEPVEETAEAPVEEAPVEEPVEETVEDSVEEPAEKEESEAPVEEVEEAQAEEVPVEEQVEEPQAESEAEAPAEETTEE